MSEGNDRRGLTFPFPASVAPPPGAYGELATQVSPTLHYLESADDASNRRCALGCATDVMAPLAEYLAPTTTPEELAGMTVTVAGLLLDFLTEPPRPGPHTPPERLTEDSPNAER